MHPIDRPIIAAPAKQSFFRHFFAARAGVKLTESPKFLIGNGLRRRREFFQRIAGSPAFQHTKTQLLDG
jgi:hypothetical protein